MTVDELIAKLQALTPEQRRMKATKLNEGNQIWVDDLDNGCREVSRTSKFGLLTLDSAQGSERVIVID